MPEKTSTFRFHCLSYFNARVLVRFFLFSFVWFVLTGADGASWILGLPAVLLAVFLSLKLSPASRSRLSLAGLFRFVPFFLRQSTLSGIDVMRRALSPHRMLNPGLVTYTTFLPEGASRTLFVNTISLLPGTLSADLKDNTVTVHTIDKNQPIWANIQNLELRIAMLLRVTMSKEEA